MKNRYEKPEQITGVIESIIKSEKKNAEYLGNSDYYVITLKLKDSDKEYEYNMPEKESFEFSVGEAVFFRSKNFNSKNKIAYKSLGKKIDPDTFLKTSADLLEKLKMRDEQSSKRTSTNKIKP